MQTCPNQWVLLGPVHGHGLLGKGLQAVLRPHWGADQAHKSKGQGSTNLGRQSPPPSAELSTRATRDQGRVLSQQGQRSLAHLGPWVTGKREDIGVDIGD